MRGHAAEQKRAARNMKCWQDPELRKIAEAEAASGRLTEFLSNDVTALTTYKLAQIAELEDWYRTAYMVLSWSVHGAAIDLDRHVVVSDDGEVKELRNEPEIEGQDSSWLCAVELLLKTTLALAAIFPDVDQVSVDQHYEDARNLVAKIKG